MILYPTVKSSWLACIIAAVCMYLSHSMPWQISSTFIIVHPSFQGYIILGNNMSSAISLGPSATRELKELFTALQPYTEKSGSAQKLRLEGYKVADKNGSGHCSLAELEAFIRHVLEKAYGSPKSDSLFKLFRPSYIRAYTKAKALDRSGNNDYISFAEFRVFNAYVGIYASMLDCFQKIDSSKDERDDNPDRRISMLEFTKRYEKTKGYGFVAFEGIRNTEEAKAVFDVMDTNAGGMVLFDEWCEYLSKAEIRMRTDMGELLEGKLQLQSQDDKTVISAISFAPSVATRSNPKSLRVSVADERAPLSRVGPGLPPKKSPASKMGEITGKTRSMQISTPDDGKSVVSSMSKVQGSVSPTSTSQRLMSPKNILSPQGPLVVSSVYTLGQSASRELKDFVSTFQPYAEKTSEGQKLRTEGFKLSDPHNKGYCSLDDLEHFIRQTLGTTFDSSRSEKLFSLFQPSYALAFAKAKELDRSGNNDGSLSFAEFRVFNADLCIYAAMYDCFCKFQSEDLDQPEDQHDRVTLNEFITQYEKVSGYGFVGLDNIWSEDAARAVFDIMDANASGIVTFIAWTHYLGKAEIRMKTEVGNLLSGKLQLHVQDDKTISSNVTGFTSPKNSPSAQRIVDMSFLNK